MVKKVDVLIIGLGPAGGAAAVAAAREGLSVLVIDRRKEVGLPVQCAEFIPLPMGKYAQSEGVIFQRITGMKSLLPSGAVEETEFPGLMIDRAAFDQALANEAARNGAVLQLESRLVRLDAAESRAWIKTALAEEEIEYRVLIAADGPHSTVAESLGLPELDIVHTRQYTVPLKQAYEDTDIWLSDAFPGGYGWLFPKGKFANLGLGADKHFTADLKTPLDALHSQLVAEGRVGEEISYRTGGAIPVGGLREQLVVGNIMLTGDAAGLTHPITGAGISAGVVSGERAGQAAAAWLNGQDKKAFADFEEDIRDQFETTLKRAVERRQWLNQHWKSEEAQKDAMHRKGWIAFPEYFSV
ncbi:NAD(P)/FAD-dependent oxidoreductase [Sulfurirhabdus autotrophica]|uniref:Geranylgeranyl reductase family protein n=1 Tax=Sulfurirhabdus autotrophica TaxID=1706046 RepID=A0A4R3XXQ5_9PROT|nr:NAD(P)/FAD-dependent oxidoreductase [Sulfurirhabdus autotrophica]TCV82554.1 geranylgeranyl reductase family protein [Sulfurirhabdus autotrophica]